MRTSVNMGLSIWDDLDDPYDHSQLAANWQAVDDHDHSPGKGKPLGAGALADAVVGSNQISNNSILTRHIKDGEVKTNDIADGAITSGKLADNIFGAMVPLGEIIIWFRPSSTIPIPAGFVVCDGRTLLQSEHDWNFGSITIPNLVNAFVMGVAPGSGENSIGGSNVASWSHSHTIAPHNHIVGDHSHVVPGHNHFIQEDGSHTHGMGIANRGNHNIATSGQPYVEDFAFSDHIHSIGAVGTHNHTGATGISSAQTTTGSGNQQTSNVSLTTSGATLGGDIRPAYVGLLHLLKVRSKTI
jgi:hypothetical protein